MTYIIKEATFDDLPEIARIHVQSWQETYIDLVPQSYLDDMNVPARQKKWEELFNGHTAEDRNLYIAYDNGAAVGFVSFGHNRDARKNGWGEIYAIYLLKQSWGKSIGYALFEKAKMKLREGGVTFAYLWALDTNKNALTSYIRWGGIVDTNFIMHDKIGDQPITEVMINFDLK